MRRVIIVAITAVLASLVGWAPAEARTCPPSTVGGKTVATMNVKGRTVPVKSVTFRNGGLLDPPATNQAAGLSKRNMPLGARKGATVITWHVRYGTGCNGTLNPLMTMPIGSTFTAGAVGKPEKTYVITSRTSVWKTNLKKKWFRKDGPNRLVLLTCDDLQGSVFRKTMVIIAKPVPVAPAVTAPAAPAPTTPAA